jgi:hypothetical protein
MALTIATVRAGTFCNIGAIGGWAGWPGPKSPSQNHPPIDHPKLSQHWDHVVEYLLRPPQRGTEELVKIPDVESRALPAPL